MAIRTMGKEEKGVKIVSLMLDHFFDPMDFNYLSVLLKEKTEALGVESKFDCPVRINIFFPGAVEIDSQKLTDILESKSVEAESGGKIITLDLGYKVAGKMEESKISWKEYAHKMFQPYWQEFNQIRNYSGNVLDTLRIPLGENKYTANTLPYLVSHLSNDDGIIEFRSVLDSALQISFEIIYVDSMSNSEQIKKALKVDSLSITYQDGEKGRVPNTYKF
jgi:hypothetical protein